LLRLASSNKHNSQINSYFASFFISCFYFFFETYINRQSYFILVDEMPFVVFIGGLLEYNSGKTTIAKDVIDFFATDLKLETKPYKPLSGNNLFYHYDQIKENAQKYNHFVSLDIVDLINHSSSSIPPTIANPVHKVNTQALSYGFFEESSLKLFFSKYSSSESLLQRFSICNSEIDVNSIYIVNDPIYTNKKFWNDLSLTDPIIKQAKDVSLYKNEQEYYSLNGKFYAEATNSAFECLKKDSEIIIVESFNNSAHPAWCIRESDIIILVSPGSLFIYEPETYFRAIDNYRSINRNKPTTTDEILVFAKPQEAHSLQINEKERKKKIKEVSKNLFENYSK
ncbi:MAG: hypothetical protein ACFFDS_10605, partial [Candidatus Thorarchaeota archaeon]